MVSLNQQQKILVVKLIVICMAILCMAGGVFSGLLRLGLNASWFLNPHPMAHGPLMVCGFLGVVISLERAVALGKTWSYAAPVIAGIGGIGALFSLPLFQAVLLFVIASIIFSITTLLICIRQPAMFTGVLLLGSVSWLAGNLLWLNGSLLEQVVPWWICFLVFTIAGERLELTRFLRPSNKSKYLFILVIALTLTGAIVSMLYETLNVKLFSVGLLGLSIWLGKQDITRHTIQKRGLPRYMAICLLSGYMWLFIGSMIGIQATYLLMASSYDAFLHTIFVGFVFCMVFGHALIILPAVAKIKLMYHPIFYLPVFLLHVSLTIRLFGDIFYNHNLRIIGGAFNTITILIFALCILSAFFSHKQTTS